MNHVSERGERNFVISMQVLGDKTRRPRVDVTQLPLF